MSPLCAEVCASSSSRPRCPSDQGAQDEDADISDQGAQDEGADISDQGAQDEDADTCAQRSDVHVERLDDALCAS